ncbi:MAG TPA: phosphoglycolate phosphatase [Burkholderiaceae bacterium]|nr:phosphoglycolate phosphatase [Burkholderiaceae bacterium]
MMAGIRLVLLDLDGTLADTAPDLAAAANRMRIARGIEPLPIGELRPYVSHGARGMVGRAFNVTPDDARYAELRNEFLREYESALCVESSLFPGMHDTLLRLEQRGIKWGIVTNKFARFTVPLVEALNLSRRAACVVSGDTTPFSKPHPAPLLHALTTSGAEAAEAIYVGDDQRDIDAGRAAGVRTAVASYGYLGNAMPYQRWGADAVVHAPQDLLQLLGADRTPGNCG